MPLNMIKLKAANGWPITTEHLQWSECQPYMYLYILYINTNQIKYLKRTSIIQLLSIRFAVPSFTVGNNYVVVLLQFEKEQKIVLSAIGVMVKFCPIYVKGTCSSILA